MLKITILIPFFNEEGNIVRQLEDIIENINRINDCKFDILLIDDGSTDNSSEKIIQLFNTFPNINYQLIKHQKNLGKTKAFETAFQNLVTDYVLFMDGDYQDDPREVGKFVQKIREGFEVIIGNQKKKSNIIKKIAALIYRHLLNRFLEIKIKTHSPQFYSIKYSYLRGMNFYNNDHRYLVIIALFKKAKFCEIDVNYLKREHGNSKFSNLKIFGAIFDTYKLILRLKARKY